MATKDVKAKVKKAKVKVEAPVEEKETFEDRIALAKCHPPKSSSPTARTNPN